MPFMAGASLALSPKESIDLVWGGATRVYNFFNNSGIQPAAAMYMANFSVVGGDCLGWRASLRSFSEIRTRDNFSRGDLSFGFAGRHVLSNLIETEYGSRWLGLLAVASTLPNEKVGAKHMQQFLRQIASTSTHQYTLSYTQCELLWNFSREIFLDSPYWYELLRITSKCAQDQAFDVVASVFPKSYPDKWLSSYMAAACHLWELSQEAKALSSSLYAKGSTGCAQLIFYLTAVCGFHVVIEGPTRSHFGDSKQPVSVFITITDDVVDGAAKDWETGYLLKDMALEHAVYQLVKRADWKPQRAAYVEPHTSMYRVDLTPPPSPTIGAVLLTQLSAIKTQIADTGAEPFVSNWMADEIHAGVYSAFPRHQLGFARRQKRPQKLHRQCQVLSERVRTAVNLLAPGLIQRDDLEKLVTQISNDVKPRGSRRPLASCLPMETLILLCPCPLHGNRLGLLSQSSSTPSDRAACLFLQRDLSNLINRIELCCWVGVNPQILRDIGPDYQWTPGPLALGMPESSPEEFYVEKHLTNMLEVIASRIAGRTIRASDQDRSVVAFSFGGFVIGVEGNEEIDVLDDPGHSIYIIPGCIETTERRVTEVYMLQSVEPRPGFFDDSLCQVPKIQDTFGPAHLEHKIQDGEASSVVLCTDVRSSAGSMPFLPLIAIEKSPILTRFSSCFGECAAGRLTESEIKQVQICTPANMYTDAHHRGSSRSITAEYVQVVMARGNALLRRAIISRTDWERKIMLLTGDCVPCAIRAAVVQKMNILIC